MDKIFTKTDPSKVYRSAFNLSYEKKYTADMGELIPVLMDEAVPGDVWDISSSAIIRFQPLVAPIMHQIKLKTYYFFVPYRILDENWEEFITRGNDGDQILTLPTWTPTGGVTAQVNKLWDYLGFPTETGVDITNVEPLDYPRRAYNLIYNEFMRDQNLQTAVALTNEDILKRNWNKDYFTSALPWTQRGTEAVLPVTGSVDFTIPEQASVTPGDDIRIWGYKPTGPSTGVSHSNVTSSGNYDSGGTGSGSGIDATARLNSELSDNNVIAAQSVGINDLRLAFQTQVWMERNARAGVRYTEFLKSHFKVSPSDARLQRPEFIAAIDNNISVSEVLQTSSTSSEPTPQGNMAGRAISLQSAHAKKYRVEEFGVIVGLATVVPDAVYQQGINRQWLRRTALEFYFPEFGHLGEQVVQGAELVCSDDQVYNEGTWGYTGRYNEMRFKPSMVVGEMKDTFDYWHLGRQFDVTNPPTLDGTFLECDPRKDIFAVSNVPGLICTFGNHLNVLRPLPFSAEPYQLGY